MQAIAEEVVSTSGGGAKYITSGFSAYNGHTAIGFGSTDFDRSDPAIGLGVIQTDVRESNEYDTIYGHALRLSNQVHFTEIYLIGYPYTCVLVF